MINKIVDIFRDNGTAKNTLGIIGIGSLLLYIWIRSNSKSIKQPAFKLPLKLSELISEEKHPNVKKIVITESKDRDGITRKLLLDKIKKKLKANNIKVLVNCSPQMLLKSGCEFFFEHVQYESNMNCAYYHNALKMQLAVQKTIIDINGIQRKNNELVIMICDNNSIDVKVNANPEIWNLYLKETKIDENLLVNGYDLVLHLDKSNLKQYSVQQNQKIRQAWENHTNYHNIPNEQISNPQENKALSECLNIIDQNIINWLPEEKKSQYKKQ